MLIRVILMFIVLAAGSSALFAVACYTDYFNKARLLKIARNSALLAVGLLVALITICLMLSIGV